MKNARFKILFIITGIAMIFFAKFLNQFYGWNLSRDWLIDLAAACVLSSWLIILIGRWIKKQGMFTKTNRYYDNIKEP